MHETIELGSPSSLILRKTNTTSHKPTSHFIPSSHNKEKSGKEEEMMASLPMDDDMTHSPGGRKAGATAQPPPEQGLNCPRCDSPNTKFCYYNNYSLTQPRHFCKTCRRYWTKGGALRNVPVGGGCRKNKKSKSSSSSASSSRMSSEPDPLIPSAPEPTAVGLQFFHGLSPPVEFQMAGGLPFSRLNSSAPCGVFSNSNQFFSFGDLSCPTATISSEPGATATNSLVGFNYPFPTLGIFNEMGGPSSSSSATAAANTTPARSSLASSIESLSSMNQDLHWKLQQQRLALIFGGENHGESTVASALHPTPHDHLLENQHQPMSYQIPESSKPEVCVNSSYRNDCAGDSNTTTGWFLENSYTTPNNNNGTSGNTANNTNTGNWNTWNDMHQFGTLP